MKKIANLLLVVIMLISSMVSAQTAPASSPRIGIGTPTPHASSALDITSTSKGFLMPRMTLLQRDAIASPAAGLMVYNTSSSKFNYYNGTAWMEITGSLAPVSAAPDAPVIGEATASAGVASVTFSAPANDGGAAITNYIVTSSPGDFTGQGTASPIEVTGLVNGTAYTFTVVAVNSLGTSSASAASNSVTPATVPAAPTNVVATLGDASASIAFTAGASNGSAITNYTVTASPGGATGTGTESPITVTGLTNGTAYTFTVVATNALGNSVASSASASVTPLPPAPGVVSNLAVKPGSSSVFVSWEAPATGGPVDNYILQRRTTFGSPNVWTDVITLPASTLSHNVTGLQNGINGGGDGGAWDHLFRVKSVNNLSGEAISDQLTAIAVAGTTLMHDNFNQQPSAANWQVYNGPFSVNGAGNNLSSTNLYNTTGRWNIAPSSSSATTSAQTIVSLDRSSTTKEVQFTYYTNPNGTGNGWYTRVGLVDPDGRRFEFYVNNVNNGNMSFIGAMGDMTTIGGQNVNKNIQFLSNLGTTAGGYVTVRIVLPAAGGLEVYSGATLRQSWSAAEIPASFNNLKFYAFAQAQAPGQQFIDNVTLINHQ